MNCKPGDLAIIVRNLESHPMCWQIVEKAVGRIVRVTTCQVAHYIKGHIAPPKTPVWEFEEPLTVMYEGMPYRIRGMSDQCLQPLPPLNPEEETETLREKELQS